MTQKLLFKGQLFGAISSGGAVIPLDNGYALNIIAESSKFVTIQVIFAGIGEKVKGQSWQKTKVVKDKSKPKPPQLKAIEKIETESQVDIKQAWG